VKDHREMRAEKLRNDEKKKSNMDKLCNQGVLSSHTSHVPTTGLAFCLHMYLRASTTCGYIYADGREFVI
jgi:hypothetical protein